MGRAVARKRIKLKNQKLQLKGARYWLAMGTLAAYSAAGGGKLAVAKQNEQKANTQDADQAGALPVRRYDIAAGPLSAVLPGFGAASGLKIKAADDRILAIGVPGLTGSYTVNQALDKLLESSGISYRFTDAGDVILELKRAVSSIDVTASADSLASTLPKYQQAAIDLPQTITAVSQQTMEQQGNTTLRDALRNVAGISLAAGEGGSQGDNLTIRGFSARNDLFIDGMRDFGSYYRDPFNTQEVEVLQGPSSVAFGRGSTGGVVNQETKAPRLTQFTSAELMFGTDNTRRAAIDIGIPLPGLGTGAALRLNAMGDIGDVAGRSVAENRRTGFAPTLSLGLGTPTRVSVGFFHQNEDNRPDYGVPWLFNGPAPVNRTNYYGSENGNFLRTYADIATVKAEHDINDKLMIRDQVRYSNYSRDVLITEPQLNGYKLSTPLSAMQVTRNEIGANSTETYLDEQLDLIAHVETGKFRHTIVTGVDGGRETSDPTRPKFTAPTTSLLNPVFTQSLLPNPTISSSVKDSALSAGVYALDTVTVGKFDFTGGIRFDRFDNTYSQTVAPASNFERVDQKPTWKAAAVYKPVPFGSLYFDAGTSFNPSAESLSLTAGSANIPPETNKTYEFGTKWLFNKNRLTVNSSWFRTTKENARETSPTNSLLVVLAGTQRVSGVETDVHGRITSRWDMLAGYAYLDSRVVGSQFFPAAIGYRLANVPRHTFNMWNTFHLPKHFELGAGANYVSSRTASSTVPLDATTGLPKQVPGYWVFNAMVGHPLTEHIDVQINAYNLANRYYYDLLHPNHIILGPGRYGTIGFKFHF